jgi:hypothetical protein
MTQSMSQPTFMRINNLHAEMTIDMNERMIGMIAITAMEGGISIITYSCELKCNI